MTETGAATGDRKLLVRRRRPGMPIRWQIALLIVAAQLIAIVATLLVLGFSERGLPNPAAVAGDGLAPFTVVVGTLENLPPRARDAALAAALAHEPRLEIVDAVTPVPPIASWGPGKVARRALGASVGRYGDITVAVARSETASGPFGRLGYLVAYRLPDGRWLTYAPADTTIVRTLPPAILTLLIALLATPLAVLFVWAGATLVSPLARLAENTERFGSDLSAPPPRAEGPREVRSLARTIGVMRERIRELLDARTTSLAAIGHDLRTPLTRLRLRMEGVGDAALREAMLRDAEGMARMIDRGLDYLRDRSREPDWRIYDLVALARTVADDATLGAREERIVIEAPRRIPVTGDPEGMRRALENLIGNALTFGTRCRIGMEERPGEAIVRISDDGPGIPAGERERMMSPFERGGTARSGEGFGQGFGLGLAIARDMIASAEGTLALRDAPEGGLLVEVRLPLATMGRASSSKLDPSERTGE